MNPILISALFGFFKGLAHPGASRPGRHWLHTGVLAPVVEETLFRAPLGALPGAPYGLTAVPFALEHLRQEKLQGTHALKRFADVTVGGLLYEHAFRKWGLLGAIAAHAVHNLAIDLGAKAKRR